jgi:hypothetical protein
VIEASNGLFLIILIANIVEVVVCGEKAGWAEVWEELISIWLFVVVLLPSL